MSQQNKAQIEKIEVMKKKSEIETLMAQDLKRKMQEEKARIQGMRQQAEKENDQIKQQQNIEIKRLKVMAINQDLENQRYRKQLEDEAAAEKLKW